MLLVFPLPNIVDRTQVFTELTTRISHNIDVFIGVFNLILSSNAIYVEPKPKNSVNGQTKYV